MEKKAARRQIRQSVRRLTAAERAEKSAAIRLRLNALPELRRAQVVMGFLPMPDELDTLPILADLLAAGKRVYVPRTFVRERRMIPVRLADLGKLRRGEYGILEPETEETCAIGELDFVIVPGRAFDRKGNRLGRGAGFYDEFMAQEGFRAIRCGVAFACQVLDEIPHGDTDLPVQHLVTEEETLRFPAARSA
jgi:5-formyltetrahydrofolate cyclo-ligase